MKDKSPEKRYEERLKQSKPILDAYFEWLKSIVGTIDSGSMIGKAINYSLNQQDYLERYLLDGSISIDKEYVSYCTSSVQSKGFDMLATIWIAAISLFYKIRPEFGRYGPDYLLGFSIN